MLESGDHALELLPLDRLQAAARLTKEQHLRRVVDVLDEVIDAAVVIECVVKLKLPLAARLVDESYLLRVLFVFSQVSVSAGDRDGLAATS
jgi:hypothetical protein